MNWKSSRSQRRSLFKVQWQQVCHWHSGVLIYKIAMNVRYSISVAANKQYFLHVIVIERSVRWIVAHYLYFVYTKKKKQQILKYMYINFSLKTETCFLPRMPNKWCIKNIDCHRACVEYLHKPQPRSQTGQQGRGVPSYGWL